MYKKDRMLSILCIGFGIGMCVAAFLFIASYYVYLDIATSDEKLAAYFEVENNSYEGIELGEENTVKEQGLDTESEKTDERPETNSELIEIKENEELSITGGISYDGRRSEKLYAGSR